MPWTANTATDVNGFNQRELASLLHSVSGRRFLARLYIMANKLDAYARRYLDDTALLLQLAGYPEYIDPPENTCTQSACSTLSIHPARSEFCVMDSLPRTSERLAQPRGEGDDGAHDADGEGHQEV